MSRSAARTFAPLAALVALLFALPAWGKEGHSLKETARDVVAAALGGDLATAKKLALTFDQASRLSNKITDRAAYERELDAHLSSLATALPAGAPLPTLDIDEVLVLPANASDKRKREVILAVVKPIFADAAETEAWETLRGPFYFIQTEAGWRLSIKK